MSGKAILKEIGSTLLYIVVVLGITWLVITFVGQRTEVNGSSMEPTLSNNDNLIVDKISYRFKDPQRFDIIVFPFQYDENVYYIKRIIGLPGETVQIGTDGTIYIDGQVLEEDFAFGMVTNTRSVGGFKGLVNQSVALNDGLFEVLLIRMPRTPVDLSNIVSYMFLKEEPNEYVYKFKTSSIRMTSEWGVDWVLDGEYGGTRTEVNIGNLKERIQILLKK